MRYYVTTIQHFVDEAPSAQTIFSYNTRNEALAAYYYTLSSSIGNPQIERVYCEIFNEYGDIMERKFLQVSEIPDEEEGME
ncbi:MAG: hypothetical protein K6F53_10550 [Lachnospiraceae bacterium]|nr:hypothetical protein [Lachnospiraceae bacterium]